MLLAFFGVEFLFGWLSDFGTYARGYSTISFIGLYLLARFMHSRYANSVSSKLALSLYLTFTLLTVIIAFFGYKYLGRGFSTFKYSSPFVIVSSVLLLLTFSNMTIKSKVINWIAVSVLSIYLVHQHPIAIPYFKSVMQWAHSNMGELYYSLFALGVTFAISVPCIVIDKIRIYVWNWNYSVWLEKAITSFENRISRLFERLGY